MTRTLLAATEERWILPSYSSRYAGAWIAAYEWLTLPFRVRGVAQRYTCTTAGRQLTVLAVGSPKRTRSFCDRLLGPLEAAAAVGQRGLWAPVPLAAANADLAVAEIHRWAAPRFRRAGWRIVPRSVRWQGDLAGIPPAPPSSSLRDDLRKVRQHRYELQQAESAVDWDEFYTTMVVPQAERRFGDEAWIPSPGFVRSLRKVAVLHFVCRAGVRVGGFCIVPAHDRAWFPLLATLAGDETLRREGVAAAAYALGIEWARARGYRSIDEGRTSSFVNDGIAGYKRKWGLAPVPDPLSQLFAVKLGPDPAVAEAFAREPVLIETDTGLAEFAGEAP